MFLGNNTEDDGLCAEWESQALAQVPAHTCRNMAADERPGRQAPAASLKVEAASVSGEWGFGRCQLPKCSTSPTCLAGCCLRLSLGRQFLSVYYCREALPACKERPGQSWEKASRTIKSLSPAGYPHLLEVRMGMANLRILEDKFRLSGSPRVAFSRENLFKMRRHSLPCTWLQPTFATLI